MLIILLRKVLSCFKLSMNGVLDIFFVVYLVNTSILIKDRPEDNEVLVFQEH